MEVASTPPLAQRLRSIGISESYASQLVNGRRTPSFKLARKIEERLGIPVSQWRVGRSHADQGEERAA